MGTYSIPFRFGIGMVDQQEDEVDVELSDEDAGELLSYCLRPMGFTFEQIEELRPIYDAVFRAAMEKVRETVTEDPSVIAEYLYEWDYAEPGQPITDELIELYLSQEPIEIDLPDPRRGGFDRLPGR